MKYNSLALALLFCAAAFGQTQNHPGSGEDTKILALEHAWNLAEEKKDVKALDEILDDSMIYVDYEGALRTKAEFLAKLRSATSHPQQEITESMAAHMFGSTGVVSGIYVARGTENGKPYVRRGRFLDTWIYRDGIWVCISSQATPIEH